MNNYDGFNTRSRRRKAAKAFQYNLNIVLKRIEKSPIYIKDGEMIKIPAIIMGLIPIVIASKDLELIKALMSLQRSWNSRQVPTDLFK